MDVLCGFESSMISRDPKETAGSLLDNSPREGVFLRDNSASMASDRDPELGSSHNLFSI